MATDEVMKNYFARFIGHEMMFMVFSSDFHGIFTNLSFIVVNSYKLFQGFISKTILSKERFMVEWSRPFLLTNHFSVLFIIIILFI